MEANIDKLPNDKNSLILFDDGQIYYGIGFGNKGFKTGEICFTTGLSGYQETLTDPSFEGQIITFTMPHIGNTGANSNDMEGYKIKAHGLICRELPTLASNYRSEENFEDFLITQNIIGVAKVDTRKITRFIRKNGSQNILIYHGEYGESISFKKLQDLLAATPNMSGLELCRAASCLETHNWNEGTYLKQPKQKTSKIVVIDYGIKHSILRSLVDEGGDLVIVPADTSFEEILNHQPDGIFLSNGPGDPMSTNNYTKETLKKIIAANIPLFCICMGHQLLALAIGGHTYKLPQGHRGINHPVKNIVTGKIEITSQNHGFAVDKDSLPGNAAITHVSLFDNTVEGIKLLDKPVFSVQYHPESSPGPHDSKYLFEEFFKLIKQNRR